MWNVVHIVTKGKVEKGNMENKRKSEEISGEDVKKLKHEVCLDGERCNSRNVHHFKEYEHPHLNRFIHRGEDFTLPEGFPQTLDVVNEQIQVLKSLNRTEVSTENCREDEREVENSAEAIFASSLSEDNNNTMLYKLKKASPYHIFFNKVPEAVETMQAEHTITFTDLLCVSLGELECSLQITFLIDFTWLMEQYQARGEHEKPLTVLYGKEKNPMNNPLPNVIFQMVRTPELYGTHHSKVGLYSYKDGSLRVVVSTANLHYEDWNHYNQGLWVSPTCKPLPEHCPSSDGESPTKFKMTLIKYLESYNSACLNEWIDRVKSVDFSHIKVFLVTSRPGKHYPMSDGSHIHRVSNILSTHCIIPKMMTSDREDPLPWSINAQASSIGSLKKSPEDWLCGVMLRTLAAHKERQPTDNLHDALNVIYPTVKNVMNSCFGAEGGKCLSYNRKTGEKQTWLKDYLHQWVADSTSRTRVMAHIKTYCRISPCLSKLAWFLLTSANISQAAWGMPNKKDESVKVLSYEVGVMFVPSFFGEEYFSIRGSASLGENESGFPFIYDLPLAKYSHGDCPWYSEL